MVICAESTLQRASISAISCVRRYPLVMMPAEYSPPRRSTSAISRCESDSMTSGARSGSPPNQLTERFLDEEASIIRSASATTSSCTSCDIFPRLWFSKQYGQSKLQPMVGQMVSATDPPYAQAARPIDSSAARSSNLQITPRRAKRSIMGWPSSSSSITDSRNISIGVYSAQLPLNRLAMATFLVPGTLAIRL